ncbi:chaperone [Lithospermum erythrorhizon]|uniref:Chaperone n=1 Tax=Lithospermum erythrorhizon TaxID=34254 RepID=A0AAV3R0N4_LITER
MTNILSWGPLAIYGTPLYGYKQSSHLFCTLNKDLRTQCLYVACDACCCFATQWKNRDIEGTRLRPPKMGAFSNFEVSGVDHDLVSKEYGIVKHEEKAVFSENSFEKLEVTRDVGNNQSLVVNGGELALNDDRLLYLEELDEKVLSKRILELSRLNKVRSVWRLFKSMTYSGLKPDAHALNSLLSCLLRKGMLDNALKIFEFMRETETVTGHTYSIVLKAMADTRGCNAAFIMFEELERSGDSRKHFDAIVYNTIISAFGKVGNYIRAEKIWKVMQRNGCSGNSITYRLLICLFVRCGQNDLALDAYHEMVHNDIEPNVDAMQAIIGACAKEGKWHLAFNVFEDMLSRGLKPNLVACNAVISSLGKAGKVQLALNVYGVIKSLGYESDAYTWNALLVALYRANRYSDALFLFERIKKSKSFILNLHIYNTALMCCKSLGRWDKALQLLWQIEASDLSVSSESYNLVIGACEVARRPEIALEVYSHMVEQNHSPDTFTLLSLVRGCIWGSRWEEIEDILSRYAPNSSLFNAAIQGMCLRGMTDSARKLYQKMLENDLKPDGKTRALMLQNLRKRPLKRR